jgi:hypothetical protein
LRPSTNHPPAGSTYFPSLARIKRLLSLYMK